MKITENYMEKVYAGWLGKIIGIRLGAPIEGWTYQRIRDVFGEVWSYPADYKNFAADDDSNGPLFFIRALEDCEDSNNFSSKDVANALLNYAPYEHGFFWWGGYGVSTEHTAYLNLRNGIPAPRSGSIEQNGATMAGARATTTRTTCPKSWIGWTKPGTSILTAGSFRGSWPTILPRTNAGATPNGRCCWAG